MKFLFSSLISARKKSAAVVAALRRGKRDLWDPSAPRSPISREGLLLPSAVVAIGVAVDQRNDRPASCDRSPRPEAGHGRRSCFSSAEHRTSQTALRSDHLCERCPGTGGFRAGDLESRSRFDRRSDHGAALRAPSFPTASVPGHPVDHGSAEPDREKATISS